jgi:hypothetical protein
VLKSPRDSKAKPETLVIANIPPHRYQVKTSGKLAGFVTKNQAVIENFNQELQAIRNTVIDQFEVRQRLVTFLAELTSSETIRP